MEKQHDHKAVLQQIDSNEAVYKAAGIDYGPDSNLATIRHALLLADRLMGEPSSKMFLKGQDVFKEV